MAIDLAWSWSDIPPLKKALVIRLVVPDEEVVRQQLKKDKILDIEHLQNWHRQPDFVRAYFPLADFREIHGNRKPARVENDIRKLLPDWRCPPRSGGRRAGTHAGRLVMMRISARRRFFVLAVSQKQICADYRSRVITRMSIASPGRFPGYAAE